MISDAPIINVNHQSEYFASAQQQLPKWQLEIEVAANFDEAYRDTCDFDVLKEDYEKKKSSKFSILVDRTCTVGMVMIHLNSELTKVNSCGNWSDYCLWWIEEKKWLEHSNCTLASLCVNADSHLYFSPRHRPIRLQLPDCRILLLNADFSCSVFSCVTRLCSDLGISFSEELSLIHLPNRMNASTKHNFSNDQLSNIEISTENLLQRSRRSSNSTTTSSSASSSSGVRKLKNRRHLNSSTHVSVSDSELKNVRQFDGISTTTTDSGNMIPLITISGNIRYNYNSENMNENESNGRGMVLVVKSSRPWYYNNGRYFEIDSLTKACIDDAIPYNRRSTPLETSIQLPVRTALGRLPRETTFLDAARVSRCWLDSERTLAEQNVSPFDFLLLRFKYYDFYHIAQGTPVRIHQLYEQLRLSILSNSVNCTEKEALHFAALQYSIDQQESIELSNNNNYNLSDNSFLSIPHHSNYQTIDNYNNFNRNHEIDGNGMRKNPETQSIIETIEEEIKSFGITSTNEFKRETEMKVAKSIDNDGNKSKFSFLTHRSHNNGISSNGPTNTQFTQSTNSFDHTHGMSNKYGTTSFKKYWCVLQLPMLTMWKSKQAYQNSAGRFSCVTGMKQCQVDKLDTFTNTDYQLRYDLTDAKISSYTLNGKFIIWLVVATEFGDLTKITLKTNIMDDYVDWLAIIRLFLRSGLDEKSYDNEKRMIQATLLDSSINDNHTIVSDVLQSPSSTLSIEQYFSPLHLGVSPKLLYSTNTPPNQYQMKKLSRKDAQTVKNSLLTNQQQQLMKKKTMMKQLLLDYLNQLNFDQIPSNDLKLNFIERWRSLPDAGFVYFHIQLQNSKKLSVLGLMPNRIVLIEDADRRVVDRSWRLDALTDWFVRWETSMITLMFENDRLQFTCTSCQCQTLHEFIGGYVYCALRFRSDKSDAQDTVDGTKLRIRLNEFRPDENIFKQMTRGNPSRLKT
ncbi:hypothetical protein SNEBB_001808 [Seison nebaliae]|nr:hypothetical protein SNEBB_001808 [Seison nebaliae]